MNITDSEGVVNCLTGISFAGWEALGQGPVSEEHFKPSCSIAIEGQVLLGYSVNGHRLMYSGQGFRMR
jgi:hypothetical protein